MEQINLIEKAYIRSLNNYTPIVAMNAESDSNNNANVLVVMNKIMISSTRI